MGFGWNAQDSIATKDDIIKDDEDITADSCIEGATVFVKNLNFKTDDEELKIFFSKCGPVLGAKKHNTKCNIFIL